MARSAPVYLDNAATTRPLPAVRAAMARTQEEAFGNPSSRHGFGTESRRLLEDAREFLRGTLGAARVVFTSGGSEADLLGVAGAAAARPPGRVLVGAADHPAVLAQTELLGRLRHRLVTVPTDRHGVLDPEALFERLGRDVRAVAILHGHNELGSLAPVEEIVGLVRKVSPEAHVHVDLVQAYGKAPFDLGEAGVDSVAVSAHKLHGPRGVGILALASETRIVPLQPAGGQEGGLRGGTENVAGAVGLAVAAEHAFSHLDATARHTEAMAARLLDHLTGVIEDVERLGDPGARVPHVLSVRLPGIVTETLAERAAERDVAFSIGSACHDTDPERGQRGRNGRAAADNHVLAAIGLDRREGREVARFSFCGDTTPADVDRAGTVLAEEIRTMLEHAPRRGHGTHTTTRRP